MHCKYDCIIMFPIITIDMVKNFIYMQMGLREWLEQIY